MKFDSYHFIGVGGVGMSGLAQVCAARGLRVSGSDRSYDRGERKAFFRALAERGVRLYPQDGSGLAARPDAAAASTAIEDDNPDIAAARAAGTPIVHRSEVLAELLNSGPSAAVTGTSGKTTTTAMLAWMMETAGWAPTVVNGGVMNNFAADHPPGNAVARAEGWVCAEADESDGSAARFAAQVGVVTTLSRDHKEIPELLAVFEQFVRQTRGAAVLNADYPALAALRSAARRAVTFGFARDADVRVERARPRDFGAEFEALGRRFRLRVPGLHNVSNAAAALAAGRAAGLPLDAMEEALAGFAGVRRRLEIVARPRGVAVVDDYAHNPEKIAAALAAVRPLARRLIAVFQPHGFGPTKFMREDLAAVFAERLRNDDALILLDIYYAGGTADKSISSADVARDVVERGGNARVISDRDSAAAAIAELARPGDAVLVMGARDDTLTDFCRRIAARLEAVGPE